MVPLGPRSVTISEIGKRMSVVAGEFEMARMGRRRLE